MLLETLKPVKLCGGPNNASYRRFRRRIIQRSSSHGPAASTPLDARWQNEARCVFDPVCQRLQLDSPPTRGYGDPEQRVHQSCPSRNTSLSISREIASGKGVVHCPSVMEPKKPPDATAGEWMGSGSAPRQGWVWRGAVAEHGCAPEAGSNKSAQGLKPFTVLDKASGGVRGQSVTELAAPSLLDDYYTNLLDCSSDGLIALALGSSVYLWHSERRALVGSLEPSPPQPGQGHSVTPSISCLGWSRDGRELCIGTRRGNVQLWDVEHKQKIRCLPSHLSVVKALSWKQQLVSSGSMLGCIHHVDTRAPAPLVGSAVQGDGVCSLQWSPGEDQLASGSTEGHLRIWDGDIAGFARARRPVSAMNQPSAVKAMGWCPWQRNIIATGGGWKDGELRIWDTEFTACVTSANTNSQICSLRWAEKKRCLVTGHGLPQHRVTCWTWDCPSLSPIHQLTGHCQRVLHLALNADCTQIFSAGADQRFHVWDI